MCLLKGIFKIKLSKDSFCEFLSFILLRLLKLKSTKIVLFLKNNMEQTPGGDSEGLDSSLCLHIWPIFKNVFTTFDLCLNFVFTFQGWEKAKNRSFQDLCCCYSSTASWWDVKTWTYWPAGEVGEDCGGHFLTKLNFNPLSWFLKEWSFKKWTFVNSQYSLECPGRVKKWFWFQFFF